MFLRRHRLLVFILAFLVIGAPARGQELLNLIEAATTEFTLDNGMTFIVVERHEAPVVSMFTYANVGSVDEPLGQTGIAHMFEHMAFKGTSTIGTRDWEAESRALQREEEAYLSLRRAQLNGAPDGEIERLEAAFHAARDSAKALIEESEYEKILEEQGATGLNAFTSWDQTGYFYSLPANKLELWMATESARFDDPVLREFYIERDVVKEERRLRTESNPQGRLFEEFMTTAYKAHPYGSPVVGHMSDLNNISRTDAEAFFATHYRPNNLTVAIVGDVDPVEVQEMAQRYFGPLEAGSEAVPVYTVEPEQLGERRVTITDPAQPFVMIGYHRPSGNHPDDAAYRVLDDILSGGRTSRFHKTLVETSLALGANSYNGPGEKYPMLFVIGLVPSQGVAPDSLERAAYEVIDEIIANGVTQEELSRAKARARASLVRGLQSNLNLAIQMAEAQVLNGDWRTVFRELDEIDAVSAADVQRVARETFTENNRTVATLRTEEDQTQD